MLTWLADNTTTLLVLLGLLALVPFGFLWIGNQRREKRLVIWGGIGLAAVALLGVLVLSLDTFVETDAKQIEKAIAEMGEGVKANDLDRTFAHISKDFRYRTVTKERFRQIADGARKRGEVTEVVFWDVDFSEGPQEGSERTVKFRAKARGSWGSDLPLLCRARFAKEADGRWRLRGFEVFNAVADTKSPLQIPHLDN